MSWLLHGGGAEPYRTVPWCRGWYAANEQRVALVPRVVRGENSEEATGKEPKGERRSDGRRRPPNSEAAGQPQGDERGQ